MNYQNIYNSLISTRLVRKPSTVEYYETHHILPKSLGGTNDKSNLVKLTAREHYLAHWLLTKIHFNCIKMWTAFALMSGRLSPKATREFSDAAYERCKKAQAKALSLKLATGWHPMQSSIARKKISDSMKKNNPTKTNPSCNWTAREVQVHFDDGTVKTFACGTIAAKTLGIPYSTWKWSLQHNAGKLPKYFCRITQSAPKPSNKKFQKANHE